MKKRAKRFVQRISAAFLAIFILTMNFMPFVAFAEGNFNPGNFNPGNFNPGDFNPGDFDPGDFNPGNFNPGDFNPGDFSPGDFNPGDFSPGDFNPGDFSPGDFNPGDFTPGDFSPGDFNPGNSNPGAVQPGNIGNGGPGGIPPYSGYPINPNYPYPPYNGDPSQFPIPPYYGDFNFYPGLSPGIGNTPDHFPGLPPYYGNLPPIPPSSTNQPDSNNPNLDPYLVTKYIADTTINGQVKMISDSLKDPDGFNTKFLTNPNYLSRLAVNGFRLGLDGASVPGDILMYGHDGVDNFFQIKGALDDYRKVKNSTSTISTMGDFSRVTGTIADGASTFSKMGPLAKLNFATAGVSAGFAVYDTYTFYNDYKEAKTGQEKGEAIGGMMASSGDVLMNVGTMLTAIPVPAVQAVGVGVMAVGGVLWVAGTATRLISRHWDKIKSGVEKYVQWRENTKKTVVNFGKKLLKAGIKSLFSR